MKVEQREHFFFSTTDRERINQYYNLMLSGEEIDSAKGVKVVVSGLVTTRVPGEVAVFVKEVA